jgi:hypothetical protein
VETKDWERLCDELLQERAQLRNELAKLQHERDAYEKAVYVYMRKESPAPTFTKEEIMAHLGEKPTFAELIAELNREHARER